MLISDEIAYHDAFDEAMKQVVVLASPYQFIHVKQAYYYALTLF